MNVIAFVGYDPHKHRFGNPQPPSNPTNFSSLTTHPSATSSPSPVPPPRPNPQERNRAKGKRKRVEGTPSTSVGHPGPSDAFPLTSLPGATLHPLSVKRQRLEGVPDLSRKGKEGAVEPQPSDLPLATSITGIFPNHATWTQQSTAVSNSPPMFQANDSNNNPRIYRPLPRRLDACFTVVAGTPVSYKPRMNRILFCGYLLYFCATHNLGELPGSLAYMDGCLIDILVVDPDYVSSRTVVPSKHSISIDQAERCLVRHALYLNLGSSLFQELGVGVEMMVDTVISRTPRFTYNHQSSAAIHQLSAPTGAGPTRLLYEISRVAGDWEIYQLPFGQEIPGSIN